MSTPKPCIKPRSRSKILIDTSICATYESLILEGLPDIALEVWGIMDDALIEAFFVGGCVRDSLLGKIATDFDLTTEAKCDVIESLFLDHDYEVYETGIKHGTVTVVEPVTKTSFEITTYRSDGEYSDSRHPDSVEFVSNIEEDLARRDFTINAIAFSPAKGIRDPFDGIGDINKRIIRTVGDARLRFSEDALRILRAARFCSQLGFDIQEETLIAMTSEKSKMSKISSERITHELDLFVVGEHVHDALMRTVDAISFVLPELVSMKDCEQRTKYHIYDVLEHTAYVMQNCPPKLLLRWAALCHDMGKPAAAFFDDEGVEHFYGHANISVSLAKGMLNKLTMSTAFINDILLLVKIHDDVIPATSKGVKRALRKLDGRYDLFMMLCELKRADALSQAPACAERVKLIDELIEVMNTIQCENQAFTLKDLAIKGDDLIKAGIDPGPRIGELLDFALDRVIEEEIENERQPLMDLLSKKF